MLMLAAGVEVAVGLTLNGPAAGHRTAPPVFAVVLFENAHDDAELMVPLSNDANVAICVIVWVLLVFVTVREIVNGSPALTVAGAVTLNCKPSTTCDAWGAVGAPFEHANNGQVPVWSDAAMPNWS